MTSLPPQIDEVVRQFRDIYLGGIPLIIRDKSAFLSFVCVLTGIEALSGYRFSNQSLVNRRFKDFITAYFPPEYHSLVEPLWKFRNKMVHAFCPAEFGLTHHNSSVHFSQSPDGRTILNAEDFFKAFASASEKFFTELESGPSLHQSMLDRINDLRDGGGIAVVS